jgi:chromosomal replication initiator protein
MVAKSIESNVRELEGAVTKIISMKRIGTVVSEEDVAQMLQIDIDSKRRRIKPIRIIESVGEVFDVTPREIKGDRRTAYIALARQIAMYLLREELGLPLERVAKEVNRKDHTTVLHACEKIEELLKKDERVKIKMEKCRELFI